MCILWLAVLLLSWLFTAEPPDGMFWLLLIPMLGQDRYDAERHQSHWYNGK